MSVKLDFDVLIYYNIPLKYVTLVGILNIMYIDTQKNHKCCDNLIKKAQRKKYR